MAITVTIGSKSSIGSQYGVSASIAFDSSYPTGGYSLAPSALGLLGITGVIDTNQGANGPYIYSYVQSTKKLKIYSAASGGGGTTSSTSGGTPAGTVTAPTFSGALLGNHSHNALPISEFSNTKAIRMYLTSVVGTPAPGDTVTGGTSTETATVSSYTGDTGFVVVTGPSGAFTTSETLTFAPSGATATMIGNLVDAWTITPALADGDTIVAAMNQAGTGLVQTIFSAGAIPTGQFRFYSVAGSLETSHADAYTSISIVGNYYDTSADSAGTPSGTNSVPTFTGSALATHSHTYGGGGGGFTEISNGTNLSTVTETFFVLGN